MLAVSPYESHHDDRFFHPYPADYDPTRGGLQCPGSSLHEVPGVGGIAGLVFGGGRYRCNFADVLFQSRASPNLVVHK